MRTHTQAFKEQIKELGREIDSRITYGSNVITSEELFSVSPVVNGSILKSSMKQLDFESSVQLHLNTVLEYQFGLKVNGEYEYLNYGNFIVYSSEYNEDMKSWSYVCYDSMLFTMKEYTNLQNGTFPMTVRDYLTNLCLDCGLVFKNANDDFANYDKFIPNDLYANLGYTYRDILDELSQVTASTICLDSNNQVEVRYITETNDTIDEEYLKDINVKFGEKYGPINSIVLSRSAESDNVYLQDEESIASNGLCELKIIDNQIMNDNNRSDYLPDILEKLNGLEYYTNDYSSTGILYYELCDRYTVQIGENTYSCVLFNDEPKITQGLVENIYTELPEESQTDYTKADKTDRRINQTYIIANKLAQEIQSVTSKVDGQNEEIAQVTQTVKGVQISVSEQQTQINNVTGEIERIDGTLNEMNYNFGTDALNIAKPDSPNSAVINNNGTKLYTYDDLKLISNQNGTGVHKLIVTGDAQIGYLRFVKELDEKNKECTDIHHLVSNIQTLQDLEVENSGNV